MLVFDVDDFAEAWNIESFPKSKWKEGIGDRSLPLPEHCYPASRTFVSRFPSFYVFLSYEVTNGKGFTISVEVMCYFRFQQEVVR